MGKKTRYRSEMSDGEKAPKDTSITTKSRKVLSESSEVQNVQNKPIEPIKTANGKATNKLITPLKEIKDHDKIETDKSFTNANKTIIPAKSKQLEPFKDYDPKPKLEKPL